MFWMILLGMLLAGVPVGYARTSFLRRRKPEWQTWRRVLSAAGLLPAIIMALIIAGSLLAVATLPRGGEGGAPITIAILAMFGVPLAAAILVGGLLGAALCEGTRRR